MYYVMAINHVRVVSFISEPCMESLPFKKAATRGKSCDTSCAQVGYNKKLSHFRLGWKPFTKLRET